MTPDWPTISTDRLSMRPARIDDLPDMQQAIADPRFPSNLPLAQMLRESSLRAWLERMTSEPSNPRLWAITVVGSTQCVGTVALVSEQAPRTWRLSYWLSPEYWHQGLASEAVAALLGSAARLESYERVVASVAQSNLASIRLLERIGFTEDTTAVNISAAPEDHIRFQRWLRKAGDI